MLKWVGGKTQLLNTLLSMFPQEIENYYEPFVGGGSVLFAVIPRVKGTIYASDLNSSLITYYQTIQKDPKGLESKLENLAKDYNPLSMADRETYYYFIREKFNKTKNPEHFYFLNKTGFRGLYRENSKGEFNVPFGNYRSAFQVPDLTELSRLIQNVTFECKSYDTISFKPRSFVYLDPPYVPENTTSFVNYQKGGFDHEKFIEWVKSLNVKWIMSNSNTDLLKNNFNEYREITARRAINAKAPGSKTTELIIMSEES